YYFSYLSLPSSHLLSFPTRRSSDLTGFRVFADAMVDTCILLVENSASENNLIKIYKPKNPVIKVPDNGLEILQSEFKRTESFQLDRKSTRLNSSHVKISYAVFCLKK